MTKADFIDLVESLGGSATFTRFTHENCEGCKGHPRLSVELHGWTRHFDGLPWAFESARQWVEAVEATNEYGPHSVLASKHPVC